MQPKREERLAWSIENNVHCEFVSGDSSDVDLLRDVLFIRQETDSGWPSQHTTADSYSDHYCLYIDGNPAGAISVTSAKFGPLLFEEFYPSALVETYRHCLASAYHLRVLPEYRQGAPLGTSMNIGRTICLKTWQDQLRKGCRLDVINVEPRLVPYYRRFGYVLCEGYDFDCPIFHTRICVMILPADGTRNSLIQDFARNLTDPVSLTDVRICLNVKWNDKSSHGPIRSLLID